MLCLPAPLMAPAAAAAALATPPAASGTASGSVVDSAPSAGASSSTCTDARPADFPPAAALLPPAECLLESFWEVFDDNLDGVSVAF